jgi:hypothetical protein
VQTGLPIEAFNTLESPFLSAEAIEPSSALLTPLITAVNLNIYGETVCAICSIYGGLIRVDHIRQKRPFCERL